MAGLIASLLALLGLGLLGAVPASAHAELDHSDPPADALLPASPAQIALYFTEEIEPGFSHVTLDDQTGRPVAGVSDARGPAPSILLVTLPPHLPNGTYSVVWHAVAKDDGHATDGYFAFTIGTQANVQAIVAPIDVATGPPAWLQSVVRWLAFLGLAISVAIWPVWLFVLRPAISPAWQVGPDLVRRVCRVAVGGIALALTGDIAVLLVEADATSGNVVRTAGSILRETRVGHLWLLRAGLLLAYASLLVAAPWWRPWRRRAPTWTIVILAATLPVPFSLVAHAAAQPAGRATAVTADYLHLVAASLWAGGLIVLVVGFGPTLRVLTPSGRRAVLTQAIRRFSLLALTAWGILGVTGFYSAWLQVGNWAGLRTTVYGQALTVKVLLSLPLLALGAFNLLIVTNRLRSARDERAARAWSRRFLLAISVEVTLAVSVLLVAGLLTSQAPAREVLARRAGQSAVTFRAGGRSATLLVSPSTPGVNRTQLSISGSLLPQTTTASLRLTPPGKAFAPQDLVLVRGAGNEFEVQTGDFTVLGSWTIDLIVRVPGQSDWTATHALTIGATPPTADVPGVPWYFDRVGLLGLLLLAGGIGGTVMAVLGRDRLQRRTALGGLAVALLVAGLLLLFQGHSKAAPASPDARGWRQSPSLESPPPKSAQVTVYPLPRSRLKASQDDGARAVPLQSPSDPE